MKKSTERLLLQLKTTRQGEIECSFRFCRIHERWKWNADYKKDQESVFFNLYMYQYALRCLEFNPGVQVITKTSYQAV